MLLEAVTDRELTRQPEVSLNEVLKGHCVRPLLTKGLDKTFGFAVGSGYIRSGTNMLQAKNLAGLDKLACDIGQPFGVIDSQWSRP